MISSSCQSCTDVFVRTHEAFLASLRLRRVGALFESLRVCVVLETQKQGSLANLPATLASTQTLVDCIVCLAVVTTLVHHKKSRTSSFGSSNPKSQPLWEHQTNPLKPSTVSPFSRHPSGPCRCGSCTRLGTRSGPTQRSETDLVTPSDLPCKRLETAPWSGPYRIRITSGTCCEHSTTMEAPWLVGMFQKSDSDSCRTSKRRRSMRSFESKKKCHTRPKLRRGGLCEVRTKAKNLCGGYEHVEP